MMNRMSRRVATSLNPQTDIESGRLQMRRAWMTLFAGLLLFATLVGAIAVAASFYFRHATQPEMAQLSIISGSGALIRSPGDLEFRLITGTTEVSENDEISTTLGTVVWVTLFDGSTVEVAEDTVLTLARMRTSRFLASTKHIVLEPQHGTIYVAMAPRGNYGYSELTIRTDVASVTMADGNGTHGPGSFLVEVQSTNPAVSEETASHSTRAAVLRGTAILEAGSVRQQLSENEQVQVDGSGRIGEVTTAIRELVTDGSFRFGLTSWVEFHDAGQRGSAPSTSGSVEFVNEWIRGQSVVAVEFLRGPGDPVPARTGIRQRIGQTLRVFSSVRLQLDLKISAQEPVGGGLELDEFPLVVELNYIDIMGEERQWQRRFYAIADPDHHVPLESGVRVDLNAWEHVIFELHNLSPLPRQITSIVLYASGQSYQTMVTNISLTSSELGRSGQ
jgi:hypothetical protein